MVLNQRVGLAGNKQERIIQALDMAGWHSDRQINLLDIERYYTENGIELFQAAKDFFAEFSGISSKWYIEVENLNWSADFTFKLFPYPSSYKCEVRDYMFDDQNYGELYATHEYDEKVYTFYSLIELISHELLSHDMMSVAMRL